MASNCDDGRRSSIYCLQSRDTITDTPIPDPIKLYQIRCFPRSLWQFELHFLKLITLGQRATTPLPLYTNVCVFTKTTCIRCLFVHRYLPSLFTLSCRCTKLGRSLLSRSGQCWTCLTLTYPTRTDEHVLYTSEINT
jgi:hypothetical protein